MTNKKYNIIYADPPWDMGRKSNKRVLVPEYPIMTVGDISNLNIDQVCDDNCGLFLWTINGKLPDGIDVIKQWGFRYVGIAFCWIKTSKKTGKPNCRMAGNYTLQGVELCLLGVRGSMKVFDRTVRQVIMSPREYHSKKPSVIREDIVKLFGNLPRIELFAREKCVGWDVWGNEVDNDVELLIR